ncbi:MULTISPECIES: oligosaccharide flippase family protein [Parabacteroides]|uniref:oligosaccharide flippase family protein n=1 Tax=Parabacteroides provencensis TaxID=1944636 RepID=UPI000C162345|nr:oligosaccharide flippase family protein [Parabacteroides provencensis]
MNDKKLLIRNSLSGVLQLFITAVLTFLCVPVLISKLGLEVYGVFAVLSVVSNLGTLADLGMDRALIVYLSNQGKTQESNFDIFVALSIKLTLLCVLIAVLLSIERTVLLSVLNIPIYYYDEAVVFFRCVLFSNAFMILGMSFASVLDSLQKVYINSFTRLIYSIIYWLGLLFVAIKGYGLTGIGVISVIASLLWFVMTVGVAFKLWGTYRINGIKKQWKRIFYKQIIYSSKIFSASVLNLFFEPLSKILISKFIGLNAVALFDVALRIRGQIASLFSKAIYPLGPYIANSKNTRHLYEVVADMTKKIHLVVIPFSLIFIFISKVLIYLWMGEDNLEDLSLFVAVLCGGFLLLVPPTYPIYQYLYTKSLAGKTVWIQCTNVVVNVLVFFCLYNTCGLYTILISNSIAYFCSYLLSDFYLRKYILSELQSEYSFYIKMFLLFVTLLIAGGCIRMLLPFSVVDIVLYPVVLLVIYVVFVRIFKLVVQKDIVRYFSTFPLLEKSLLFIFGMRKESL